MSRRRPAGITSTSLSAGSLGLLLSLAAGAFAQPVFVDVEEDTANIDVSKLESLGN